MNIILTNKDNCSGGDGILSIKKGVITNETERAIPNFILELI